MRPPSNSLRILCFIDRASRYIRVIKTNLMHYLSSVYFVNQPLHDSGIFIAHHQEVYYTYTTIGTCCAFQLTACTVYCIYTVYLLMMGYKYARNM
jgi:hypothetical protein